MNKGQTITLTTLIIGLSILTLTGLMSKSYLINNYEREYSQKTLIALLNYAENLSVLENVNLNACTPENLNITLIKNGIEKLKKKPYYILTVDDKKIYNYHEKVNLTKISVTEILLKIYCNKTAKIQYGEYDER